MAAWSPSCLQDSLNMGETEYDIIHTLDVYVLLQRQNVLQM